MAKLEPQKLESLKKKERLAVARLVRALGRPWPHTTSLINLELHRIHSSCLAVFIHSRRPASVGYMFMSTMHAFVGPRGGIRIKRVTHANLEVPKKFFKHYR